MPRFYFHTEDGVRIDDDEGADLPSLADARREGARVLGEMLRERPDAFWADGGLSLTVTDESGLTLFTLEVSATHSAATGGLRRS
jgi:hypothetical protein